MGLVVELDGRRGDERFGCVEVAGGEGEVVVQTALFEVVAVHTDAAKLRNFAAGGDIGKPGHASSC